MKIIKRIASLISLLKSLFHSNNIRRMLFEETKIKQEGKTAFYSEYARSVAVECGADLRVNNLCLWSGEIHFGNNCNFNGMKIRGGAKLFLEIIFIQEKNVR